MCISREHPELSPEVSVRATPLPTVSLRKRVSFAPANSIVSEIIDSESRQPYLKDMYYQDHEYWQFYNNYQRALFYKKITKKVGKTFSLFHSKSTIKKSTSSFTAIR